VVKSIYNLLLENAIGIIATLLMIVGYSVFSSKAPQISGAMIGAGASLLGAWITDLKNRRFTSQEKERREAEARKYFAPELNRIIERVLYIHGRAIPNFTSHSAEMSFKPNDLSKDFLPDMPVLYPIAPQFKDLSGDDATSLVFFYDSLRNLERFISDWWEREGQLPVNIFNSILGMADESLALAMDCIVKFDLEILYPPKYESLGTLTSRIEKSRATGRSSLENHIARSNTNRQTNGRI
jgi:hypothetical protein